jgi:predicted ferric reductase
VGLTIAKVISPDSLEFTIKSHFVQFRKPANGRVVSNSLVEIAQRPMDPYDSDADRRTRPWFGRAAWGAALCTVYPLLAIAPLVALHILQGDVDRSAAAQLGINCALVGFTLLSMQFVLTARLPWIEAPFGLDLVLRFHRAMALAIVALLCAHAALIASAEGWSLLTRLQAQWYIWAARIALFLLLAQVSVALLRSVMRLSYERWRRTHNTVALVILTLGFAHSVRTSDDLKTAGELSLWALPPALGFATWLYSRVIRRHVLARRTFRVQSVKLEAPRVWTVTLETPAGHPFSFLPGQFQFLRLLDSNVPTEEHPFSIASSPTRPQHISLTIKACGNFTTLIDRIRVGELATVHGPFGRFSHDLHPNEADLVFVAGGVGITPLMSMLRAMHDRGEKRRVTLIYACHGLDDVLFIPELVAMEASQCPALKVICVLSQPPSWWSGETGHVDAHRLDKWCSGLEDKAFYLCCPSKMNVELVRGLRHRRVSQRRIHCDYFAL